MKKTEDALQMKMSGHLLAVEVETGNVVADEFNDIHPQNMARAIARGLANESNYYIHRVALGNGGTSVNAAFQISYKTPNTGVAPDPNTFDSRLYNETYSEIVDDSNVLIGTDPGSFDPNGGQRIGGGSNPAGDPTSVEHVSGPGVRSNELGTISQVVVQIILNPSEPTGQPLTDNQAPAENTETAFTFDEIALFTAGGPAADTSGSQTINVGNRTAADSSTLLAATQYSFTISVDGGASQVVVFTTPAAGGTGVNGAILYGDVIEAIMTGDAAWNSNPGDTFNGTPAISGAAVVMTDPTGNFTSIPASTQTYGSILFSSSTTGATSAIAVTDGGGPGQSLIANLNQPTGGVIQPPKVGSIAGVQNDPVNPSTERERMLTHVIFSPFLKSQNRTLSITYTLTVSVASV
jgi:hypothetical protein